MIIHDYSCCSCWCNCSYSCWSLFAITALSCIQINTQLLTHVKSSSVFAKSSGHIVPEHQRGLQSRAAALLQRFAVGNGKSSPKIHVSMFFPWGSWGFQAFSLINLVPQKLGRKIQLGNSRIDLPRAPAPRKIRGRPRMVIRSPFESRFC